MLQKSFIISTSVKLSVRHVAGLQTLPQVLHKQFLLPRILLFFSASHFPSASSEVLRLAEGNRPKIFQ